MRIPRVPIGLLMLAVGFIAVDVALFRAMFPPGDPPDGFHLVLLGPGLIVTASLLLFQLGAWLLRLWRTRRIAASFLAGFQAAGWASLGSLLALGLARFDGLVRYSVVASQRIESVVEPGIRALGSLGQVLGWGTMATIFTIPVLVLGLLGGIIARRLGIVVEVRVGRLDEAAPSAGDEAAL